MAVLTADFELGTNGSDVLTADTGSATAWNVRTVAGGTLKYSTTQAAGGTKSMAVDSSASGSTKLVSWTTALGTVTDHYGRFYFYATANPGSDTFIWEVLDGGTQAVNMKFKTDGKLNMSDWTGVAFTTASAFPLNQWIRIEYHLIHSLTVGQIEFKYWTTPDSTGTPTATHTTSANRNTRASVTGISYGCVQATGTSWIGYWDEIVANATNYPGPVALPADEITVNVAVNF